MCRDAPERGQLQRFRSQTATVALPPGPVLRERAGVRVISNVEQRGFANQNRWTLEITLILSFARRTGRRTRLKLEHLQPVVARVDRNDAVLLVDGHPARIG